MTASGSSSASGSGFPKWQIAVGIGAAGAIGLGIWYLRSSSSTTRRPTLADTKSSVSIDDKEDESLKDETPFQRAQRFKKDGNSLFRNGKYDEAIGFYNKAIEVCPAEHINDLATFYQNRAAAYEQLKKWSAVIQDCTRAIELNPKYEKALMRRAKAEEIVKDWENCLDDVTCVCLLENFRNQNALLMADRVLKELGKKHAAEAIQKRKPVIPSKIFIHTYFSAFSEDPVYKKLQEVGEPLGQGELKGFLKAKLAFATGKYEEIIPACTEEIDSSESESPYLMEALSLRGGLNFLTGAFNDGLKDFTTIIESENADVKIKVNSYIKRASIYQQLEKFNECLQDLETAVELGPDVSDVYHHRGQVKLLMERADEARADFSKAVELNPNFPIAYMQKVYSDYKHAMATKNVDLLTQSLANFRKAIEKFPDCPEGVGLYAQVLTESKDYLEADETYEKILKTQPDFVPIYVHRGLLYLQWKGDVEKAVEWMRKAIDLDDKYDYAYETLGTIEVQRGNLLVAIELFNKAIALARTENEMVHLFALRDAAMSQLKVQTHLGIGPQLYNKD